MKLKYFMDVEAGTLVTPHTSVAALGQLPFNVTTIGYMHAKSAYFTEREGMDSYLLIYTVEGSGYLYYRNSDYSLKPGEAVFINCNEYQFYKTSEEGHWKFHWIHFHGSSCQDYFRLINGNSCSVITLPQNSSILGLMAEITALSTLCGIVPDVKLSNCMSRILTELIENKSCTVYSNAIAQYGRSLDKVIEYIKSNYSRKIGIDELAKLTLISKFHFSRIFKAYTGLSPYEYIIKYRINISKSLLQNSMLSVNEICENIGFGDVNNYIKYFKKVTGMTPMKFRNCSIV